MAAGTLVSRVTGPELVRAGFSAGLRLSSVIVVPSALVLAVLGPPLAEVFLAHGATSEASARYMGEVFAVLRLGGLDGRGIGRSLLRMHAAAVPAAVLALAVSLCAGALLPGGTLGALVTVGLAGCAALPLYLIVARSFRVAELTELVATATARLRR
jgi:putative peptidoglycan lipid II flippase